MGPASAQVQWQLGLSCEADTALVRRLLVPATLFLAAALCDRVSRGDSRTALSCTPDADSDGLQAPPTGNHVCSIVLSPEDSAVARHPQCVLDKSPNAWYHASMYLLALYPGGTGRW